MEFGALLAAAYDAESGTSRLYDDLRLVAGCSQEISRSEFNSAGGMDELSAKYDAHLAPHVTAVVLTRNEEDVIERCLGALSKDVDDILVIDSGSEDGTVDAARSSAPGVAVLHSSWVDDFSHHRNLGLENVGQGWVLFVDADETLDPASQGRIRRALKVLDFLLPGVDFVLAPRIIDTSGSVYENIHRFMRSDTALRFRGRVHERPYTPRGDMPPSVLLNIDFSHRGYEPEFIQRKSKDAAYSRLVDQCREDDPENLAWVYYQSRSALDHVNDPDHARQLFGELERAVRNCPADAPDYLSDRRSDCFVILCELALRFGGANEVHTYASELEGVGRVVEATYYRTVSGSSRALGDLSRLVDGIEVAAGYATPGTAAQMGKLFEFQALLSLACGRYDEIATAAARAAAMGVHGGLKHDMEELRRLLAWWDAENAEQ
ncbi:glycosyltransferase family 2 protein [Streptomyces sp. NPDC059037]|uniref:glycosyltransferase family 2 protein n=1 Tax=Streptomyces sp. NPDC059037 TaxID=3346710 RepID=UPI0036948A4A